MCQGLQGCWGRGHGAAGGVGCPGCHGGCQGRDTRLGQPHLCPWWGRGWWHRTWPVREEDASHLHELVVVAVPAVLPGLPLPCAVLPEGQLVPALGNNSRAR